MEETSFCMYFHLTDVALSCFGNVLLSILNQINNNIQFTMEKSPTRLPFLRYNDKQKWYKNLDGYL